MRSVPQEFGNASTKMQFDDAKDNFFAAARHGLKAQVTWLDGKHHPVDKLINEQLISLAKAGLKDASVDSQDIDRYLSAIRERVEAEADRKPLDAFRCSVNAGRHGIGVPRPPHC